MLLPVLDALTVLAGTKRVHAPVVAGIRGQARQPASPPDTTRLAFSERIAERETCKPTSSVVLTGENVTPSLEGGGR
jgi:hypothetical protein